MLGTTSLHSGLTRRTFLKTTAVAVGSATLAGGAVPVTRCLAAEVSSSAENKEKTCQCNCRSNCAENCIYTAHVRDGKLVKLEVADYPDTRYTGSCLKGLSYVERIYSPARVKYPLRRVGERGEDKWERISWEEAIDEIATKWKGYIEEYGPQSIVFDAQAGNWGQINGIFAANGLANAIGASKLASGYDQAAGHGIDRMLGTGDWNYANEPSNVLDSSMIVVWGTNPVLTSPQKWRWIQWAKEKGAKIVALDPIKSATAHRADQYIQVTPGNDGYLALAMSNYLIEQDLVDEAFVRAQTNADYLVRRDTKKYLHKSDFTSLVEGEKDDCYVWDVIAGKAMLSKEASDTAIEGSFIHEGIEVDTVYSLLKAELKQYGISQASEICGVSEEEIVSFAESFAREEAVSVYITYGLDHYVNGYLTTWAVGTLMALTGNLAKKGAGFQGVFLPYGFGMPNYKGMYMSSSDYKGVIDIPSVMFHEVCATQTFKGEKHAIKSMITHTSNSMSNFAGQNNFLNDILPALDFYVAVDIELCDSARYADIVLPCASWYEVDEFSMVSMTHPYVVLSEKAIEPLYESKPDSEIFAEIGRKMGYHAAFPEEYGFDYLGKICFDTDLSKKLGLSFEKLKEKKVLRCVPTSEDEPYVRGVAAPFPTKSAKIELYCETPKPRLKNGYDLSDRIDREHIVYYRPSTEASKDSELAKKYPLVFLQEHSRFRVHTQWHGVPLLRELDPEPLAKVNGVEAEARGVKSGDFVEVFNDRGHAVLKCLVDESISPGVLSIPKGWQREQFEAGCFQEMTIPDYDPYPSTFSYYDSRVDFKKWEG